MQTHFADAVFKNAGGIMSILQFLLDRLFKQRPFFYNWEQRAYERRQEQSFWSRQNLYRNFKD